jgi:flagellar hook-associated protein 1 FlgK
MGLDVVLRNAVSGIHVAQEALQVHSQNVSNVNTPGYVKRGYSQVSRKTDGAGQGAEIASIGSIFDQRLFNVVRERTSAIEKLSTISGIYDSVQNIYGNPNSNSTIASSLDQVFSALNGLATSPDVAANRSETVQNLNSLTNKINKIATDLQQQRFEADRQIGTNVTKINNLIGEMYEINKTMIRFDPNTAGRNNLIDQREQKLRELSELIDIQTFTTDDDQFYISTAGGISLLDPSAAYKVQYTPSSSIDAFIGNNTLSAAEIYLLDDDGSTLSKQGTLIPAAKSGEASYSITGGTIKGLLDMRDVEIPRLLSQLDNFASTMRENMNATHNKGTSFPPPTSLTGARAIASTDSFGFDGSIRIAILNSTGTPAASTYSDETYLRPLTLDFSKLNSGGNNGEFTASDMIKEINNYFGPPQSRASLGNLRNVQLAAVSNSIAATPTSFSFDFELDNASTSNATFDVLGVTVLNPADDSVLYTLPGGSLPASYTSTTGELSRTGSSITIDLSAAALTSYKIRANVKVTEADGTISTSTIDYSIDANVSNIRNDRYPPQAINSGDATLITGSSSQRYATARLVNANGQTVSGNTPGYLLIETNQSGLGFAIDSLDSAESGITGAASSSITGRNFSHYFELNNLFKSNATTAGSAYNLELRSDILADPNKIAVGQLTKSNPTTGSLATNFTYELGKGNGKNATALAQLNQESITFAAAGSLPESSLSLTAYIGDMSSFVGSAALRAQGNLDLETLTMDGLKDLVRKGSGVNTDEELAKIIEIQHQFEANAKLFSITRDMLDRLMQSF